MRVLFPRFSRWPFADSGVTFYSNCIPSLKCSSPLPGLVCFSSHLVSDSNAVPGWYAKGSFMRRGLLMVGADSVCWVYSYEGALGFAARCCTSALAPSPTFFSLFHFQSAFSRLHSPSSTVTNRIPRRQLHQPELYVPLVQCQYALPW